MTTDLDLILLRSFVTAARAGSIGKAAGMLDRTQPAISLQLRKLEEGLGSTLMTRTPRGISLTAAGEMFLPYAERLLSLSSEARSAIDSGALVGTVGIGLLEDFVSTPLVAKLAEFARQHPLVKLELSVASGPAMLEQAQAGRLQLVLGDPHFMSSLALRWRIARQLTWVCAPGFDLRCSTLPLVMFAQPCRWRQPVLNALADAGRAWSIVFEANHLQAIQGAVAAGLGITTMLPNTLQSPQLRFVEAGILPELPTVEIGLGRRPGTEADRTVDALEALIRNVLG